MLEKGEEGWCGGEVTFCQKSFTKHVLTLFFVICLTDMYELLALKA